MRERGDLLVGLLVGFLLLFPLGYVLHVAPRFPGSAAGGIIGIAAVLFMLLTLPYVAAKHWSWADRQLTRFVSKPTLLAVHVYAGVLAPILGLIHAAHKFASPVGILLTGLLLHFCHHGQHPTNCRDPSSGAHPTGRACGGVTASSRMATLRPTWCLRIASVRCGTLE